MKIAIASDIYYPQTNGVAVFAHNLANELSKAGHEVLVLAPSFTGKKHVTIDPETKVKTVHLSSQRFPFYPDQINKVPDKKEFLGLQMPRLTYKNGIWWSYKPFSEVKKALDDFKPDVIHLQTAETIALAVMMYVKKRNVPLVSTGHAYPDNITGQLAIFKPKFLKRSADAVLRAYMASFLKHAEYATMPTEMAIGDLVPKDRKRFTVTVEALSNGVDLSAFKPGKPKKEVLKKYGLEPGWNSYNPSGVPRVLYVGRVDPEKSIDVVLGAFKIVAEKIPEAELTVVGDGIDLVRLKELAGELGLTGDLTAQVGTSAMRTGEDGLAAKGSRVKFLGKVMPPDLYELYKSGTVFVTASETETQGIVLIEAAATALPIVAVDAGAVAELCQNCRNGILCQPKDVEGMAKAIMKILKDPELQKKYAAGSLEVAAKHDLKRTIARFEEIYEEAIRLKKEK